MKQLIFILFDYIIVIQQLRCFFFQFQRIDLIGTLKKSTHYDAQAEAKSFSWSQLHLNFSLFIKFFFKKSSNDFGVGQANSTRWYSTGASATSSGIRVNLIGLDGLHLLVCTSESSQHFGDSNLRVDRDREATIAGLRKQNDDITHRWYMQHPTALIVTGPHN